MRYQKIDAAIVASNAKTIIQTSYGEFTVAGAISLRSRLRGTGIYDEEANFELALKRMNIYKEEEKEKWNQMKKTLGGLENE